MKNAILSALLIIGFCVHENATANEIPLKCMRLVNSLLNDFGEDRNFKEIPTEQFIGWSGGFEKGVKGFQRRSKIYDFTKEGIGLSQSESIERYSPDDEVQISLMLNSNVESHLTVETRKTTHSILEDSNQSLYSITMDQNCNVQKVSVGGSLEIKSLVECINQRDSNPRYASTYNSLCSLILKEKILPTVYDDTGTLIDEKVKTSNQ